VVSAHPDERVGVFRAGHEHALRPGPGAAR
jgi:hypothetical protein